MQTLIQSPTPNLAQSIDFYQKLGFTPRPHDEMTLFADGPLVIQINPDRYARAGLKLFKESWATEMEALKSQVSLHPIENGHMFSDPTGVWVYLMDGKLELEIEAAPTSALGNIAGLSLETGDMAGSAKVLEILGFEKSMGSLEQGWLAFQNADQVTVSLMKPNTCPHLFFNPSLTYFNGGKNLPIIDNIRKLGITITEEITHFNPEGLVDNIIIRDPGGYGFFIFND